MKPLLRSTLLTRPRFLAPLLAAGLLACSAAPGTACESGAAAAFSPIVRQAIREARLAGEAGRRAALRARLTAASLRREWASRDALEAGDRARAHADRERARAERRREWSAEQRREFARTREAYRRRAAEYREERERIRAQVREDVRRAVERAVRDRHERRRNVLRIEV